MSLIRNVNITAQDSPSIDAFGRWRVSEPYTLFDSKNVFDDPDLASNVENQPLFFDNQQTAGSGTSTAYNTNQASQSLTVGNTTAGTRVRQTKRRFNYQPGKSQLFNLTFTFATQASGITQREGCFDEQNGLFLEDNGTNYGFVRRTYTSGSAVDNRVTQANWAIDKMDGTGKSGIDLDFTKTQILFIDYEWLGVGRVRMGFVVDGLIYYAHEFNNANTLSLVYMSTPNLPIRSEISNSGAGPASTMTQICSTVISEGGLQDTGLLRYASTSGTHLDANTENTVYALMGMRLKSGYLGATVKQVSLWISLQTANHEVEWILKLNPTVAGAVTFTGVAQSAVEIALGATANTITGGYDITGGTIFSSGAAGGGSGALNLALENALTLGSTIAGVSDVLVLCVRPIGGSTNVDVEGGMTWRELL